MGRTEVQVITMALWPAIILGTTWTAVCCGSVMDLALQLQREMFFLSDICSHEVSLMRSVVSFQYVPVILSSVHAKRHSKILQM
eukprot:COSAG05_NODE_2318_length_3240_cov_9.643426_4_plen_84_part_00